MTTLETRVVNPVVTTTPVKNEDVSCSEMVDAALAREEEEIVDEEISSEGEEEALEQAMMQAALAKSVEDAGGSPGSRYGLRKRRRPGDVPAGLTVEGPPKPKGAKKDGTSPNVPGILKNVKIEAPDLSTKPPRVKITKTDSSLPSGKPGGRRHGAVPTPIAPNVPPRALSASQTTGGRSVTIKLPLVPMKASIPLSVANPILATPNPSIPLPAPMPLAQVKQPPTTKQSASTPRKDELVPTTGAVPNPLQLTTPTTMPAAPPPDRRSVPETTKSISSAPPAPVPCPLQPAIQKSVPAPESEDSQSRSRAFSVDLDPSTFDFTDIGASLDPEKPGPPEPVGSGMELPQLQRERAFSFEFFNFAGGDELLPGNSVQVNLPDNDELPDPADMPEPACIHRPRGDSIIFDPVSFQDGGIHEKNALMKVKAGPADVAAVSSSVAIAPVSCSSVSKPHNRSAPATMLAKPISTLSSLPPFPGSIRPDMALSRPQVPLSAKNSAQVATLPSALSSTHPSDSESPATFQMELLNKDGRIGIYLPDARKARIARFHAKRKMRIWRKRIKYDCRKKLADSRPRIKGRFVKRSDMEEE